MKVLSDKYCYMCHVTITMLEATHIHTTVLWLWSLYRSTCVRE